MKKILLVCLLALISLVGCSQASSSGSENANNEKDSDADFPSKPIEVIVGFGPGGASDTIARTVANAASKYLPNDQSFVIKNVPGGAAIIGTSEVYNAEPDGYKIGFSPSGPLSVLPHLGDATYSHDSFETVIKLVSIPQMLHVQKDAPWNNFEEWAEYVRNNPGKFTFSTPGIGGEQHLAMEALNDALGVETVNVPYNSGGESSVALLGGEVDGSVVFPGTIGSDDVKILFSFSGSKEGYDNVPTLLEEGVDVASNVYGGIIAPKGISDDRTRVIHDAFKKALEDEEVIGKLEELGYPITYGDAVSFQEEITNDANRAGELLKKLGLIE